MKKSITFSIIFLFFSISFFSQECFTKTDPFTNEVVSTFTYSHPQNVVLSYLKLSHANNSTEITMTFGYGDEINKSVPKGSEILLKLENGLIIRLITKAYVAPVSEILMNAVFSFFAYSAEIDAQSLKELSKFPITNIRYPDARGEFVDLTNEHKWMKRYFKNLLKGAACILR